MTEEEQMRNEAKEKFRPVSLEELTETLGLTIKEDNTNKIITFLCCLSAYTENAQFNLSFNAPSSSGKSYIPIELASLFPKEDVLKTGYASPTAFFHDKGEFNKETGGYHLNFERKILIFIDMPHLLLLQHLRPILSHDEKEIHMKITDKSQKYGLKTKNIIIRGYPAVVFCTAGLKIDEQEATRFMLLSPETTQGKIKQGINEAIKQAADTEHYLARLNNDPARNLLIDRIKAIKDARINDIRINDSEKIEAWFFQNHTVLKPRHQRDIKRIISLIKVIALLNLWHRETVSPGIILTADQDIESGLRIWEDISFSQELNIPPYIYRLFQEVFVVLYQEKQAGLSRKDLLHGHLKIYGRPLPEWQLRREIIPMLEMAGLIIEEMDPDDKRSRLITPICPTTESTISDKNIM